MKGLNIRKAQIADARLLAKFNIANALESEALTLDAIRAEEGVMAVLLDANKGVYYVAESEGELVGALMITQEWSDWRAFWKWWLQSVYVLPEFRGQGVFDALLSEVEQDAQKAGVRQLALYMDQQNQRAEKAYIKNAFVSSHYLMLEKELFIKK